MRSSLALSLLLTGAATLAAQQPVLMISVDGMKPEYVTHAEEHGLKIPNLRHILATGTHADGVTGVFPTVTYPSHTTLVTGVSPAVHGIYNNYRFDPERKFGTAWYWYADQVKVPTLWSAAHAAGLSTASVGWPVTVDASSIDTLIPEYWRGTDASRSDNPDDQLLINAISRPDGEVNRIQQRTATPYMNGNNTFLPGDEIKTVYALDILRQHRPRFMTIHLSSLDEEEHLHGPFSPPVNADLEGLDAMIGRLTQQELANYPDAVVAVVSDHGFASVDHAINLAIPFIQAGLISISRSPTGTDTISSWKAEPWLAGGLAVVMLRDPADSATRLQVKKILDTLAADPANGIAAVLTGDEVRARGGFPDAVMAVTLRPGFVTGPALSGPMLVALRGLGTHGYDPSVPEMRASFFALGKGIPAGRNLGLIDMRQIAPTIARWLQIQLPTATQPALNVR